MPTEHIVLLLIAERDRLDAAISALGGTKRRGRPPKNPLANAPAWVTGKKPAETKKRGRRYSLAARKRQAAKMRLYWKNKRKETKLATA
jgi:hypothetical protein